MYSEPIIKKLNRSGNFPLVSIITPVYNGVQFLDDTIQSVLNQTYKNIEYIVIDGGSTDGTLDIIKKYEKKLSWRSEPDKGISDAFNKGIVQAKGEIIGIINADDWYEPETVEVVVSKSHLADIIYGNLQFWKKGQKSYLFSANHRLLPLEMTLNHPAVFVKKSVYEKVGLYNLGFKCAMDYEFLIRCYKNNLEFFYINEKFSNMRLQGTSDVNWIQGYKEVRKIKDQYFGKKGTNFLYYIKQVFVTGLGRILIRFKLKPVVDTYRRFISPIKKTK